MKRLLQAVILTIPASIGFAQNLLTARTSSHSTSIYQLTPVEARALLEIGDKALNNSQPQSWSNGEVHREYDVHETRIYCERIKAGTYHYEIPLTPRYKGIYTLNPAKAEWMYFPVIYGRNGVSRTTIR